jgi:lysophospholipid acyltransferase (LPLAT)-like uncharacterized protein
VAPVIENANPPVAPNRRAGTSASSRLQQVPLALDAVAGLLSAGMRFINATNRMIFEPWTNEEVFARHAPFIAACWHGQSFMLPFGRPARWPADVLVSRSTDAELIARVLTNLGLGVIRGSGANDPSRMFEKGAVAGFRGMKTALAEGRSVGATVDFLRHARRKVSPGIVTLARVSGRPIVPIALASSRRYTVASWDATTIALPFGRSAWVFGEVVEVPADADEVLLEAKRLQVENALIAADTRAYEIVDGQRG